MVDGIHQDCKAPWKGSLQRIARVRSSWAVWDCLPVRSTAPCTFCPGDRILVILWPLSRQPRGDEDMCHKYSLLPPRALHLSRLCSITTPQYNFNQQKLGWGRSRKSQEAGVMNRGRCTQELPASLEVLWNSWLRARSIPTSPATIHFDLGNLVSK